MTNLEYITAFLGRFGVGENLIRASLRHACLGPDDKVDIDRVKVFLYTNAPSMVPAHSSVSELGVSITYNMEAFRVWYAYLCKELGRPNLLVEASATSFITDISDEF